MINETDVCEEIEISKWKKLRNQVFEKYKDEEGYYFSGTGCYRSLEKTYFSVNLIVPLSKGGQTQLDNLQLLAKWETSNKESNPSLDILEEQLKYDKNCRANINKKREIIHEIFIKDKNNIIALEEMAGIEYDNTNYIQALEYCNRVLVMDPYSEEALLIKSFSCFELKNYKEDMECAKKLVKINETPFRLMLLGNCYTIFNENDNAIYYYNKALKMDVENEYSVELKYYIGNAYYAKNQYEEALKYFDEVMKIDSEDVCVLNDMAKCFYKLDRHRDAISMFERACRLEPEEQESYQKKIDYIRKKIFRIV